MGPPAANEYAVEPVAVDTIKTVGLIARNEYPVNVNVAMIQARDGAFADHNIIERVVAAYANVFAVHLAVHHGTLVQVAAALLDAVQGGIEIFQRHFGQESERTQIDAKYGNSGLGDGPGG